MDPKDAYARLEAAHAILKESSTTRNKFESVRTLVRGVNPRCDTLLTECSTALTRIDKLKEGDIIEVSAELLPETTEKEKKRKKAVLLFIRSWKQLHDEVHRLKKELSDSRERDTSSGDKAVRAGKIVAGAKGPLGIITVAAVCIAAVLIWANQPESQSENDTAVQTIEVISFGEKQIPLTELAARTGQDCTNGTRDVPHYHAGNGSDVKTTDGEILADPGGCAFGKVSETTIRTIPGPIR